MSNYTKTTDFEAKDSLPTGDSGKIIRGAEFETEFDAISTAIATKADTAGPTFTGVLTFETISDGTIGITAFVDEDDMSSNSATLVPTQQSVKAYVDSQVTAQDLDFQADSGGALSIDLDSETMTFTGGTGIDTSGSGNAVTFAIDSTVATLTGSQTLTNKTLTSPVLNTGVSGTAVLDEDNMASNSATQLATQQSIKAYVDSQVGANNELSEILANGNTTGGANIVFGDSASVSDDRLVFGAGSDLQIYHSGVHSYIDDAGTGNLTLRGNASIRFEKYEGEILADFAADGSASLYHDNSVKISTVSSGVSVTGNIAVSGTVDGRDVATDGSKLDGIEASADVTDTANVTAAGALMDSELTSEASVKALNQGVATTDSPTFAAVTVNGNVEFDGLSGTGSVTVTDILDQDDMSGNSATALATQQSIKAYVDSQVATADTLAEVLANGNTTGGTDVAFGDNDKAIFGAGSDLQIYHDGSNSYVRDVGTGHLNLSGEEVRILNSINSELKALFTSDGSVELYHDNAKKIETTSTGIDVTGVITTDGMTTSADINFGDNDKAVFGAGSDLQIYHDGSNSYVKDAGTGQLILQGSTKVILKGVNGDNFLQGNEDGAVNLYHNDSQKLATTSTGIDVTGSISADGLTFGSNHRIQGTGGLFLGGSTATVFEVGAGSEKMRLTSTGLGIGTSSPSNSAKLDAAGAIIATDSSLSTFNADNTGFDYVTSTKIGRFFATSTNTTGGVMTFTTGQNGSYTERMRIDASGNVGIGATSLSNKLTIDAALSHLRLQGASNANKNVSIQYNESGDYGQINCDESGVNQQDLWITGLNLKFGRNINTERMRIDDSGNLLVGRTSSSGLGVANFEGGIDVTGGDAYICRDTGNLLVSTTSAVVANSSSNVGTAIGAGLIESARAGVVAQFNRHTSDGSIIDLQSAGTSVGSIGNIEDLLYIAADDTTDCGIRFDGDNQEISPCTATGAYSDGNIDLGDASGRFKDLYLSGNVRVDAGQGILFGGAAGASGMTSQVLDDYEEGTWTPVLKRSGSTNNATITLSGAVYVKIGRMVHVSFYVSAIDYSAVTDGTNAIITNLPFSATGSTWFSGSIGYGTSTNASDTTWVVSGPNGHFLNSNNNGFRNGTVDLNRGMFTITYQTA